MNKEDIREYILDTAALYDITDCVLAAISEYDENDISWDETIETVSDLLGLSVESILTCDETAANALYKKYPYFDMVSLWKFSSQMRAPGKAEALLEYLFTFDKQENPDYYPENRIAESIKASVLRRCEQKIKDINALFPDTFPHDLPISSFHIETDYFIHHPNVYTLIQERNRVINRFSELFFEALKRNLTSEEIQEFNLYCTHFDARDALTPSIYVFYPYVEDNRELFLLEGHNHLEDYLSFRRDFHPWKAREFYDDSQFVKDYIHQYPFVKKEIREFIKKVSAYHCFYVYIKNPEALNDVSDDFELDSSSFDFLSFDEDEDNGPYEISNEILIEKTKKELGEDKELVDLIRKLVISSKLGGIEVASDYQSAFNERIARMNARFERGWVRG